jgi:antitoxin MazE
MTAVLSRWGNSLAVRIPAHIADKAQLRLGDALEVAVSRQGRITLQAVPKEVDFGALYDLISPDNRVDSVDAGCERGQEAVTW